MIVIHLPLWSGGSCHYISRYSTFLHGQVVPFMFGLVVRYDLSLDPYGVICRSASVVFTSRVICGTRNDLVSGEYS